MGSKIHLTIVITSILASALITAAGISTTPPFVHVLAQEGAITQEGSVNDTMSGQNASQWATNATLAFAQEGFQTEDLVNETIDMGNTTTTSNATLAFAQGEGEGANQTMQGAGQSANQTGEAIQGNASNIGSKITEGAKDLAGNIGDKLENIGK